MAWVCSYGVVDCPECKRDGLRPKWVADTPATIDRLYFRIPYADKEQAKALGARWDADRRLWYGLGSNPKLSEIGKRWPVASPPKSRIAPTVPDLFDVTATVPEAPTAQPQPIGANAPLYSYDDLMDAIRAADTTDVVQVQVEKKNAR